MPVRKSILVSTHAGWLIKRPSGQTDTIFSAFESIWPDLYRYVTQSLLPKMTVLECMYVRQALDLLEGLIPSGDDNKELQAAHMQKLIVFSIMWSLGALLELEDRKKVGPMCQQGHS